MKCRPLPMNRFAGNSHCQLWNAPQNRGSRFVCAICRRRARWKLFRVPVVGTHYINKMIDWSSKTMVGWIITYLIRFQRYPVQCRKFIFCLNFAFDGHRTVGSRHHTCYWWRRWNERRHGFWWCWRRRRWWSICKNNTLHKIGAEPEHK